ncbi:MAG: hypothetical protein Q9181_001812, partial [Wetmoreana brouardii]
MILKWLSPLNFRAQQMDLSAKCQEGSGQWFLESEKFRAWMGSPVAVLHCLGIPGAGKTYLASRIIKHLDNELQEDSQVIAYIYCNYQDSATQTPPNILGSILEQILRRRRTIPTDLETLHEKHSGNGTRPSTEELKTIVHNVCDQGALGFLVIDALDESQDASIIIDMLNDLQR